MAVFKNNQATTIGLLLLLILVLNRCAADESEENVSPEEFIPKRNGWPRIVDSTGKVLSGNTATAKLIARVPAQRIMEPMPFSSEATGDTAQNYTSTFMETTKPDINPTDPANRMIMDMNLYKPSAPEGTAMGRSASMSVVSSSGNQQRMNQYMVSQVPSYVNYLTKNKLKSNVQASKVVKSRMVVKSGIHPSPIVVNRFVGTKIVPTYVPVVRKKVIEHEIPNEAYYQSLLQKGWVPEGVNQGDYTSQGRGGVNSIREVKAPQAGMEQYFRLTQREQVPNAVLKETNEYNNGLSGYVNQDRLGVNGMQEVKSSQDGMEQYINFNQKDQLPNAFSKDTNEYSNGNNYVNQGRVSFNSMSEVKPPQDGMEQYLKLNQREQVPNEDEYSNGFTEVKAPGVGMEQYYKSNRKGQFPNGPSRETSNGFRGYTNQGRVSFNGMMPQDDMRINQEHVPNVFSKQTNGYNIGYHGMLPMYKPIMFGGMNPNYMRHANFAAYIKNITPFENTVAHISSGIIPYTLSSSQIYSSAVPPLYPGKAPGDAYKKFKLSKYAVSENLVKGEPSLPGSFERKYEDTFPVGSAQSMKLEESIQQNPAEEIPDVVANSFSRPIPDSKQVLFDSSAKNIPMPIDSNANLPDSPFPDGKIPTVMEEEIPNGMVSNKYDTKTYGNFPRNTVSANEALADINNFERGNLVSSPYGQKLASGPIQYPRNSRLSDDMLAQLDTIQKPPPKFNYLYDKLQDKQRTENLEQMPRNAESSFDAESMNPEVDKSVPEDTNINLENTGRLSNNIGFSETGPTQMFPLPSKPLYNNYGPNYMTPTQFAPAGTYPEGLNYITPFFQRFQSAKFPPEIALASEQVLNYIIKNNVNLKPILSTISNLPINTNDKFMAFLLMLQKQLPPICEITTDLNKFIIYNMIHNYLTYVPALVEIFPQNLNTLTLGIGGVSHTAVVQYLLARLRCCEIKRIWSEPEVVTRVQYIDRPVEPKVVYKYIPAPIPEPKVVTKVEYVDKPCPTKELNPRMTDLVPVVPAPKDEAEKTKYQIMKEFLEQNNVLGLLGNLDLSQAKNEREKLKLLLSKSVVTLEPVLGVIKYYLNSISNLPRLSLFTQTEIQKKYDLDKILASALDVENLSVDGKMAFDTLFQYLWSNNSKQVNNFMALDEAKTKGEFVHVLFDYLLSSKEHVLTNEVRDAIEYLRPLIHMDGDGATPP